jgi:hypothetical protein
MRLAFLHIGHDLSIPTIMVASVRRHMPDIDIVQMTEPTTPSVPGITRRAEQPYGDEGLMDYRLRHLSLLGDGPLISLDTDVIVQDDLRTVFAQSFDVALTRRYAPLMIGGKDIVAEQPYNAGVMFSRASGFWLDAQAHCACLPVKSRKWFGEQLAIAVIAGKGGYDVLELDCATWNCSPEDEDEDVSHAKAVHYKGARRKPWMRNRGFLDMVALPAIRAASGRGGELWQTT